MRTPPSSPAVTPALSWRSVLLWLAFATTLLTGLVLALRYGSTVPVLVDGVLR